MKVNYIVNKKLFFERKTNPTKQKISKLFPNQINENINFFVSNIDLKLNFFILNSI
jgi:hypothetical protein